MPSSWDALVGGERHDDVSAHHCDSRRRGVLGASRVRGTQRWSPLRQASLCRHQDWIPSARSHAAGSGAGARIRAGAGAEAPEPEPACALQNGLKANAHLEQPDSVHRLEVMIVVVKASW